MLRITTCARPIPPVVAASRSLLCCRYNSSDNANSSDQRVRDHHKKLVDEFADFRESYKPPANPVVLCHGLMGFDTIRLAGDILPGVEYWRGIKEVLRSHGVEVIVASVPPSASIEERAEVLAEVITREAKGRSVNMIGGIDARYMISCLRPTTFKVLSLTTIATPHHGSPFANHLLTTIPPPHLTTLTTLLNRLHLRTGAFTQLTTTYMTQTFNPSVPDVSSVKYFSYGAQFDPPLYSVFKYPHGVIEKLEGENDGLVSVKSAVWGEYEGTLVGVSHLDIINWYNRVGFWVRGWWGVRRRFNAVVFYCDLVERLGERGF